MERERHLERDTLHNTGDGQTTRGHLDALRDELDELLEASDQALDSIHFLQAQQYLQQNLQTGGQ